jgi:hypothetical protein
MRFWPAVLLLSILLLTVSCNKDPMAEQAAIKPGLSTTTGPVIVKLFPGETTAGKGFNLQPNGTAVIAIGCKGVVSGKVTIFFASKPLPTAGDIHDDTCLLSGAMPKELYSIPGTYPIYIQDVRGESSRVDFVVKPATP